MTTQQEKNQLAYEHRALIESAVNSYPLWPLQRRRVYKTLHPETLPALVSHGYMGDKHPIPTQIIRECLQNQNFAYLNDLGAFLDETIDNPLTGRNGIPLAKYDLITYFKALVGGTLETYPRNNLRFSYYSKASVKERETQRAIIRATTTINPLHVERHTSRHNIGITRIASDDLVHYLMENPDKAEDAVAIINMSNGRQDLTEDSIKIIDELINIRREVTSPLVSGAL